MLNQQYITPSKWPLTRMHELLQLSPIEVADFIVSMPDGFQDHLVESMTETALQEHAIDAQI